MSRVESKGWHWPVGAILALAMWFSMFPQSAVGVLGPFITEDLRLSKAQLGTLATLIFLSGAVGSMFVGRLNDRIGARHLLFVLFLISFLGMVLMATSTSYPSLAFAVFVGGFAGALGNPVTNDLISTGITGGSQGTLMGIKQAGVKAGTFVNGLCLPGLAAVTGWRGALLAWTILPLTGLATASRVIPRVTSPTRSSAPRTRWWAVSAGIWSLAVYAFFMGGGSAAVLTHLPLYAYERLGMTPAGGGLLVATIGFISMVVRIVYGKRADVGDVRPAQVLLLLALGATISKLLFWLAQPLGTWLVWVGAVGYAVTAGAWHVWAHWAIVRRSNHGSTSQETSVVQVAFYGGLMMTPILFGYLVDMTASYAYSWTFVTMLTVFAALVAIQWGRLTPRDPGST